MILRYYHVEKWRVGTIARQLRVHHRTVQRVLRRAGVPPPQSAERASKGDPYVPFIRQTSERYPTLTASRVYAMVRERGQRGTLRNGQHLRIDVQPIHMQRAKKACDIVSALSTKAAFLWEIAQCGISQTASQLRNIAANARSILSIASSAVLPDTPICRLGN